MIEGVLLTAFGLMFTLLGYRVFGPLSGPTPSLDPKHLKAEKLYRIVGPGVMIWGIGLAVGRWLTTWGK